MAAKLSTEKRVAIVKMYYESKSATASAARLQKIIPDLTPPDFFLWGVVKDLVYANKPRTVEDLKREIRTAVGGVPLELCAKVCRSVPSRLQKCLDVGGAQTELFWSIKYYA